MAEFRVTPQMLQNKASELQGLNAKYKAAIEELQQQESTLNGQWDGDARNAFDREFKKDIGRLQMFYSAIEDYVQKLNQIAQEYAKAENQNVSTASSRTV